MRTRDKSTNGRPLHLPGRAAAVFAVVGPFTGFACFMLMVLVPGHGGGGMDFVVHMGPLALMIAYVAGLLPALVSGLLAGMVADSRSAWISYGAAALAGFGVTAIMHAAISDDVHPGQSAAMGLVGAIAGLVSMAVLRRTLP